VIIFPSASFIVEIFVVQEDNIYSARMTNFDSNGFGDDKIDILRERDLLAGTVPEEQNLMHDLLSSIFSIDTLCKMKFTFRDLFYIWPKVFSYQKDSLEMKTSSEYGKHSSSSTVVETITIRSFSK